MHKALPFLLFGSLALVMGGLLAWGAFRPDWASDGYVVVSRAQAESPGVQAAPLRVDCPVGSKIFVPLCDQAARLVESGGRVSATRMRCRPSSSTYAVSGSIKGQSFKVKFDCNRTDRESLRSAAREALARR